VVPNIWKTLKNIKVKCHWKLKIRVALPIRVRSVWALMPIFHSVISPPLAKNFDKEIIFRRWRNLFSCYSCLKFSTSVWPFVDGAKGQQMNFFGGEIFRQRRRNTWVENGLKKQNNLSWFVHLQETWLGNKTMFPGFLTFRKMTSQETRFPDLSTFRKHD
jgi:hypothetical protein